MQYITCNSSIYAFAGNQPEIKGDVSTLLSHIQKKLKNVESIEISRSCLKAKVVSASNETFEVDLRGKSKLLKAIFASSNPNEALTLRRDRVSEEMKSIAAEDGATLYLWSSGGGGHKSAKDANLEKDVCALRDKILQKSPSELALAIQARTCERYAFTDWCRQMSLVKEADVLSDYLGGVGKRCADAWDTAQKAGDVKKQERLAAYQSISDRIFGPFVFIRTLIDLIKLKPKKVVSTQAMSTSFILAAIIVYNVLFKPSKHPEVKLHLYMTDMPTKLSSHFFESLKVAPKHNGNNYILLHTPKPADSESWEQRCGLKEQDVKVLQINELPVRPSFLKAVAMADKEQAAPIRYKVSAKEEESLLKQTLEHQGSKDFTHCEESYFLMLGSQPTESAVKEYVDTFVNKAKQNPDTDYRLFAFAGKFSNDSCFYKELCEHIQKTKDWPSNLQVVPLSFQDAEHIVSLEMNCHTITRSGGGTVMELLVLNQVLKQPKKRFIHAQLILGRTLVDSIPLWEKGNFNYLQEAVGKERCRAVDPAHLFT